MILLIIFIFKKIDRCHWDGLYVSSVGFKDSLDDKRIPFKIICLMDNG
jgi:hypothetical protein